MSSHYTPEILQQLRQVVATCKTWLEARDKAASHLGVSPDNVTRLQRRTSFWRRAGEEPSKPEASSRSNGASDDQPPTAKGAHMSYKGDVGEVDLVREKPPTLEELLTACHVDTSVWEVERFVVNMWEMGRKDKRVQLEWVNGVANGFVDDTGQITKVPLWQAKATLRRKVEETTLGAMLERFTKQAAKHAPRDWVYEVPKKGKADCCYVLNGHDLHLAKLAWSVETGGADWDINIARATDDAAVEDLMSKVPQERVEEVVVIVGSDMLQVDNNSSQTTRGTYVDSDSRLPKAFNVACDMLSVRIERLAARFRVKVVVIPGNHDQTVSFFLGRYIAAWFRKHPNVTVDSEPKSRKYHGYGSTLVTFDHGDETKMKDLPLIIMRENQSTISEYRFIEALTGHLHSEQCDDYKGVIVRTAPALCSPDKWHSQRGYIGTIRRSQGLLYQRDNGLQAIYYSRALD